MAIPSDATFRLNPDKEDYIKTIKILLPRGQQDIIAQLSIGPSSYNKLARNIELTLMSPGMYPSKLARVPSEARTILSGHLSSLLLTQTVLVKWETDAE